MCRGLTVRKMAKKAIRGANRIKKSRKRRWRKATKRKKIRWIDGNVVVIKFVLSYTCLILCSFLRLSGGILLEFYNNATGTALFYIPSKTCFQYVSLSGLNCRDSGAEASSGSCVLPRRLSATQIVMYCIVFD